MTTGLVAVAPGKVLLFGEYAVLEGHEAVVVAVTRGVKCTFEPQGSTLDFELLGPSEDDPHRRRFVDAVLARQTAPPPGRYLLDSRAMFVGPPLTPTRMKLGLGSSAASTVALCAALHTASQRGPHERTALFETAYAAHHAAQGSGSGFDIAASTFGGLFAYRVCTDRPGPEVRPMGIPRGFKPVVAFSGRSSSTGPLVSAVRALRDERPQAHADLIAKIALATSVGKVALETGDRALLIDAIRRGHRATVALGQAAGIELAGEAYARIDALARRSGAACKVTGAGGGDVVWVVGVDEGAELAFVLSARREGLFAEALTPCLTGVQVQGLTVAEGGFH